jgi:hypothetical protein
MSHFRPINRDTGFAAAAAARDLMSRGRSFIHLPFRGDLVTCKVLAECAIDRHLVEPMGRERVAALQSIGRRLSYAAGISPHLRDQLLIDASSQCNDSIARSQNLPAALSRRAQMILGMSDGESNTAVARRLRVSRPAVTLLTLFGLQRHRSRSFKLSTHPFFIEKLHDIVGLWVWGMSKESPTTTSAMER